MSGRLTLESFEAGPPEEQGLALDPAVFEEAKLAAFETGYQAGWDDAVAAQNAETARLHSDLGQNLQALSFTYQEARAQMLQALRPLLVEICEKLLPQMARDSLAGVVVEQLIPEAEALASVPIVISANPVALPQIEELLAHKTDLPLRFVAEQMLGEGQVYLRFSESETRIDLDAVTAAISNAVTTYFNADLKDETDV
ncbi:hypothetical protein [Thioclava pacifica]|uniref:Flagellar assembly protein FliH/Type III secretion system HrpE domain-containing protein n=1 Tax=Thioclava pacifica DSM 10166 TaxID=1353537 RepID=A0A074JAD8_9RHOB|nr:hypothetical protein [Thioclava pacifica]KEO54561.1 hypothetical protein TP2_06415 [Thioclava pacifica DSM 10166]